MISVLVKKQSNFAVSTPKIKSVLKKYFTQKGIITDSEVSVFVVGVEKMQALGKRYLKDKKLHSVLSFTNDEIRENFKFPPGKIYLGEIILCYPKVVEEAGKEGKLVDDKVAELLAHSADHLMGIHHEKL